MDDPMPQTRISVLGVAQVPGDLIASYLRLRFKNAAVDACLSIADLDTDVEPCAFLLIEPSAIYSVHSIARTVARVRSRYSQVPILVAAASPNPAAAAEALRCEAQGFVAPLAPIAALADALRTVLAGETWFPQTASADRPSEARGASPALLQRRMKSPPRARAYQAALGPMQPRPADGRLPHSSVELVVLSGEIETDYVGPCRRRAANDSWIGPERRQAVRR